MGLPTMLERPITTASAPRSGVSMLFRHFHHAVGRTWDEGFLALGRAADVLGVKAVHVLSTEMASSTAFSSKCFGQGRFAPGCRKRGVGVEFGDLAEHIGRGGSFGVFELEGLDAGLLAARHLVAHVNSRGRITTHQNHGQTGLGALARSVQPPSRRVLHAAFAESALPSMMRAVMVPPSGKNRGTHGR